MDRAAKWTDKQLKALEKRINEEYTKAYKEIKKEMTDLASLLQNPNLSTHERLLFATQNKKLHNLIDQMADRLKDTNATTNRFVSQSAQNIFKHNYNTEASRLGFDILDDTAVRNILTGGVNPFTKLSIAADKDKANIMHKLESEMTTAILRGESIPDIAKRLKNVSEGYLGNTIRIARTETTRVQNSARQSVGEHGKELGFTMYKQWVATNDARTRDEHRAADGQEVPIDEPFKVGGEQLMYAGDISLGASAWNVCNCRCTVINILKKKDYKEDNEISQELRHDLENSGIEQSQVERLQEQFNAATREEQNGWDKAFSEAKYRGLPADSEQVSYYDPDTGKIYLNHGESAETVVHETAHSIDMGALHETVGDEFYSYDIKSASAYIDHLVEEAEGNEDWRNFMELLGIKDDDAEFFPYGHLDKYSEWAKGIIKEYGEDNFLQVSDILSGITHDRIGASLLYGGHSAEYWQQSVRGGIGSYVSQEAWAEYCTLRMSGNKGMLEVLEKAAPNMSKALKLTYKKVFGV